MGIKHWATHGKSLGLFCILLGSKLLPSALYFPWAALGGGKPGMPEKCRYSSPIKMMALLRPALLLQALSLDLRAGRLRWLAVQCSIGLHVFQWPLTHTAGDWHTSG